MGALDLARGVAIDPTTEVEVDPIGVVFDLAAGEEVDLAGMELGLAIRVKVGPEGYSNKNK